MPKSEFVSLHSHSHHSLLDGLSNIDEYLERASELGQKGFGLTDHGSVSGVNELIQKSKKYGVTPVPGCEFYVAPQNPEGAKCKKPVFYGVGGRAAQFDVSSRGAYTHQTIWAVNEVGLHNLFKLSTLSWQQEHYYSAARIDFDMLAEHSEGLVVATGCPSSEISTRFLLEQDDEAYAHASRLKDVFGDRLFVEIMDHGMSIDLERRLLPKQLELSKRMGIPLLATQDSHYTYKHESVHHEEQLATQSRSFMSDLPMDEGGKRFKFNGDQYYLKSADEMAELFPENDYPGALSNTLLIAEMAQDIHLTYDSSLKPNPVLPENFANEYEYYKYLLKKGYKERYGNASYEVQEEAKKRIAYELEVIYSSDFVGYMLTVYDYLNYAREKYSTRDADGNIIALSIGVGRGSVGGSIHAYLLGISELCPIKHDLVFERFLSPGRGNIVEIKYSDGTSEELIVSEKRNVVYGEGSHPRYVHQLSIGDKVTV